VSIFIPPIAIIPDVTIVLCKDILSTLRKIAFIRASNSFGEKGFTLMQDVATNPQFMGPNGQFSKEKFGAFLKERDKEKDPAKKAQWEMTKKSFKQQRKREKYMQYLSSAAYVTKLEAKNEYYSQKTSKNISFVMYAFRDILDTDIKIKEAQIKDFYERNKEKKKYEVLAGRDVMYFDIAIEPSKEDIKGFNKKNLFL
jgi:peptidyl-prolyl cis-trans isomerase D